MEFLNSIFGGSNQALNLVLLFVGLTVALVLLFWVWRKITAGNQLRGGRSRQPRLSVTDAAIVDDKRRLVLVRRDNVEHLLMIGGPGDIVIEQNIVRHHAPHVQPQPTMEAKPVTRVDTTETDETPANQRTRENPARPAPETGKRAVATAAAAVAASSSVASGVSENARESIRGRASALLNGKLGGQEPAPEPQPERQPEPEIQSLDDFEVEDFNIVEEPAAAVGLDLEQELESVIAGNDPAPAPVSQTTFATRRPVPEPQPEPNFDEMLNEHISTPGNVSVDAPAIDAAPEPVSAENDMEDEMQKLLNELSVGR